MTIERSGYVAIVGRPNVGKSTLINTLLDEKISITSPKPQTTRWQILGIKTHGNTQVIFVDTPGLHQESKRAMNRYLNRVANSVIHDADIILFMIDASLFSREDEHVLQKLHGTNKPVILVINKIDLLPDKAHLLPLMDELRNKFNFAAIIPISAKLADNLNDLENKITQSLPLGCELFPEGQITDKSVRFQIAEIIREKLIYATEEELPYTTAVEIEQFKPVEKRASVAANQEKQSEALETKEIAYMEIGAVIWVEKPGQKVIVIGKKGAKLKKIGIAARREIEKLLGQKVFLRLWVKVKAHWTDDERALRNLGYE